VVEHRPMIKQTVPKKLLAKVNEEASYEMVLSPRTGVQPDDKSSQERYAFFYNTTTIEALPDAALHDDTDETGRTR
jgi:hypothetical protein